MSMTTNNQRLELELEQQWWQGEIEAQSKGKTNDTHAIYTPAWRKTQRETQNGQMMHDGMMDGRD